MTLRSVHTNKEVLEHAIIDGINRFQREALRPHGLMVDNQGTLDETLLEVKYRIAREVAVAWEHSQIDEDA